MLYTMKNHANFVAACEQLADDSTDFRTDCKTLTVDVIDNPQEDTLIWLKLHSDAVIEH